MSPPAAAVRTAGRAPRVKICGMTSRADAALAADLGAHIVGLVVEYPVDVPWNLTRAEAGDILAGRPASSEICVVTGGPPAKVAALVRRLAPDYVQLHFRESAADVRAAVGLGGPRVLATVFPDEPDVEARAAELSRAGAAALLVDPRTPADAKAGGAADPELFARVRAAASVPVILAGGLNPGNVAGLVARTGADWIDVMSGVEARPGVKDPAKLRALFQALRGGAPG